MPVLPAPGHHFEFFGILSNTAYPMAHSPRSGVVVRMEKPFDDLVTSLFPD
jgi:hypothetical protein